MSKKNHVIVVGGGASGIMSAISAKRAGAEVTILEKNPRIGKKILATGNGRCNFTNINADLTYYHGNDPEFAKSAFSEFTVEDTIRFFEKLGIAHKVEDLGKVFPMSDQASSFLDVFLYELEKLKIQTVCNAAVKRINPKNKEFVVETDQKTYIADRVIISTGGKAMPSSGSDGNGYDLAKRLGHSVTDVFPSLVQIMLEGSFFKRIDGVKILGTVELMHKNTPIVKDRGDILFANYGVSGPPVLQVSRKAGEFLNQGKDVYLKITVIDNIPKLELRKIIDRRFETSPEKTVEFSLVGLINKRLIPVMLLEAGIKDLKHPVGSLSEKDRDKIVEILTDWRIKVRGTKGWTSAQATAGGINTNEINPFTMESKKVKGLYFTGEIIDIDGQCGGFNLQWAWSSGFVAGKNAAL
ncbi:MAG: NAD(P)/FAD-dependent oxidoreductase [Clostridiaceae bacterium]|nr:NAD(P)/FAD-dependent oxidoreductase [Clostridiaceae bacterium]